MKAIGSVVGLVAGSLGLIAGAVFGLDDEGTLVSPPQIVAQGFIEAIAHGRTGPAHRMLAREAQRHASPADIRLVSRSFRSRIGGLDDVRATVVERRRDTTIVRAEIEGQRASMRVLVPLLREDGEWVIARLGDALIPAADKRTAGDTR